MDASRRKCFDEYPAPHTMIVLKLGEGPLFVSYPVNAVDLLQFRVTPAARSIRIRMPGSQRWNLPVCV